MAKIFVAGFPLDIQEIELVQLIAIYGEVATIKIVRDKKTHKCKGYAFLEMASLEAAKSVITALNGTKMGKRELIVKLAEETPAEDSSELNTVIQPIYQKVAIRTGPAKMKRPRKVS
ncbi:RNA-binding protein [Pedobacter frigiditerrae]|uniref:RNA-binding protein n=1 Tax=Pedobacter frigiditerrae TaxID=2530452 RepID=A0A4R0MP58_9SPHI|nr:RNA-binding protein [Pedobacter frigiditerrae]TCC88580.1 RNA-binding protein [Pedobacter frigiditerrae]